MEIRTKRAYDPADKTDGMRILVDHLWPRGIRKDVLQLDGWPKELAPSTEARKAFGHKAENFEAFVMRYRMELDSSSAARAYVAKLREDAPQTLTLVYAAKDPQINHAVVLKAWLEEQLDLTHEESRPYV